MKILDAINQQLDLGRLVDLGLGAKGQLATLFLYKKIGRVTGLGEDTALSGYCTYAFVYSNATVVGVLLKSRLSMSELSGVKLTVSGSTSCRDFSPQFLLENCGLLVFRSSDGGVVIIPNEVSGSVLVEVTRQ